MTAFAGFTKRNINLYFKDRTSVMYSMLTPVLIFILYALFLKEMFIDVINDASGLILESPPASVSDALTGGLLLSGVIGTAVITVSLNTILTIVNDKVKNIDMDILATPMKRGSIILSYFFASFVSSALMTSVILTFGLVIICSGCDMALGIADIATIYGITILGSLSATSFFMPIIIFIPSNSAASSFNVLVSSLSGFMIGALVPLSKFPVPVRTLCSFFPGNGVAVLLRNAILGPFLDKASTSLYGYDGAQFSEAVRKAFSFESTINGVTVSNSATLVYVLIIFAASIAALIIIYPRMYKRK